MRFQQLISVNIDKRFFDSRLPEVGFTTILFMESLKILTLTLRALLKCHFLNHSGINLFQNNLVDNNG